MSVMLGGVFGPKWEAEGEDGGGCTFRSFTFSPQVFLRVIKSSRTRVTGHVARMGRMLIV